MQICEIAGQIAQLLGADATNGSGNFAVAFDAAWAARRIAPQVVSRRYSERFLVESRETAWIGKAVLIGDVGDRPRAFAEG